MASLIDRYASKIVGARSYFDRVVIQVNARDAHSRWILQDHEAPNQSGRTSRTRA